MSAYPTLTEIEVAWRTAGTGVCVIVEGETGEDDPWFYQQWFGREARRFTFFPQDGWEKVEEAVARLRFSLGNKKVYGLRDRDFEPGAVYPPVPVDGVLHTPKYTLENYMLDAQCWLQYIQPHGLRSPKPGWSTLAEAQATLTELYHQCLPLSAYNWTLRQARLLDYGAFMAIPANEREYKQHPRALESPFDVAMHLGDLEQRMNLSESLARMFSNRLRELDAMSLAEWEQVVSGKYVLNLLSENFPIRLGSKQAWDDVLGAYVSLCHTPPADLAKLLDLIWQDAHS